MPIAPSTPVVSFVCYGDVPSEFDWSDLPVTTYEQACRDIYRERVDNDDPSISWDMHYVLVCATGEVFSPE